MIFWILIAVIVAFGVSAFLTRRFCDPASRMHLLDHPNERSLHSQPTPRTGGVAILVGLVSIVPVWTIIFAVDDSLLWLAVGAMIIAALSFLDDRHGISVGGRLFGHLLGASLVVIGAGFGLPPLFSGMPMLPLWLGSALSILFLVWMVNLYNFMDGMDGFAAGMAVIGFGTFALLGLLAGNLPFLALSLGITSAASGFLIFNFPPARIFMGDTGSATLGLLAGGLSLWGARDQVFPLWVAVLVFSPFIIDASATLIRRFSNGERVWQAHKSHYYQRLVLSGWGHRKTVVYEYTLMLACGLSALLARHLSAPWQAALVLFWGLIYLLLMAGVHHMEMKKNP